MNQKQKIVLALGLILIVIMFTFPYTRYGMEIPTTSGGMTFVEFTTRDGFRPFWKSPNPPTVIPAPGLVGIRWPVVIGMALAIIAASGVGIRSLGGRSKGANEH